VDVRYPYCKALSLTYEADEVSIVILRPLIEQSGIQIKGARHTSCLFMNHNYSKNGAISILAIFWVLVPLGVPKISGSDENMNFKCKYMVVHFFYLLFWTLICNFKTI
jgi:hypothetical protein